MKFITVALILGICIKVFSSDEDSIGVITLGSIEKGDSVNLQNEDGSIWYSFTFYNEANRNVRGSQYKLWQDGFHPVELSSNEMMEQRLDYIHQNPVASGIVDEPESYLYC